MKRTAKTLWGEHNFFWGYNTYNQYVFSSERQTGPGFTGCEKKLKSPSKNPIFFRVNKEGKVVVADEPRWDALEGVFLHNASELTGTVQNSRRLPNIVCMLAIRSFPLGQNFMIALGFEAENFLSLLSNTYDTQKPNISNTYQKMPSYQVQRCKLGLLFLCEPK